MTELSSDSSVAYKTYRKKGYFHALVDGFPLSLSVFAYGVAYGALAHSTNHLSLLQTTLMSAIVFAGASQFMILELLHQGALMWAIVMSTFLINARQILYGFTLGRKTLTIPKRHLAWLAHGMTDESFSIAIVQAERANVSTSYFAGAGTAVFAPWILSSLIGYVAGGFIGDPTRLGIDFAFIGAFLGLLFSQIKSRSHLITAAASALAATIAYIWLGTSGAVLAGACVAFCIGVWAK